MVSLFLFPSALMTLIFFIYIQKIPTYPLFFFFFKAGKCWTNPFHGQCWESSAGKIEDRSRWKSYWGKTLAAGLAGPVGSISYTADTNRVLLREISHTRCWAHSMLLLHRRCWNSFYSTFYYIWPFGFKRTTHQLKTVHCELHVLWTHFS